MSQSPEAPNRRPLAVVEPSPSPTSTVGAFDAQMLGQGGARRGLKGGVPVLEQAQHTYLETEWSGVSDRRTPAGTQRRTRV